MAIFFTHYTRPHGRTTDVSIDRPEEIQQRADKILERGLVFACEILPDEILSLTIVDPVREEDVASVLSPNDERVEAAVDRLIDDYYEAHVRPRAWASH